MMGIAVMAVMMFVIVAGFRISLPRGWLRWLQFSGRALDDLVKLTPVQPHAATLGAVIDFNSLPFCNLKIYITYWTFHAVYPL